MSLAASRRGCATHGSRGRAGLALMRRNRSFVFFRLVEDFDPALGPVAGAGVALTPLRSIAVDRAIWAYGLPFWIDGRTAVGGRTPRAVPPPDDRPGHRLGDCRDRPAPTSSSAAARRPARAPARSATPAISSCCCRERGAVKEAPQPAASPAPPERRGDRALDRGRAQRRAPPRREPADAVATVRAGAAPRRRSRAAARRGAAKPEPPKARCRRSRRSNGASSANWRAAGARSTPRSTCTGSTRPRRIRRCAGSCAIRRRAARGWSSSSPARAARSTSRLPRSTSAGC